jgi:hypothetical protein
MILPPPGVEPRGEAFLNVNPGMRSLSSGPSNDVSKHCRSRDPASKRRASILASHELAGKCASNATT